MDRFIEKIVMLSEFDKSDLKSNMDRFIDIQSNCRKSKVII